MSTAVYILRYYSHQERGIVTILELIHRPVYWVHAHVTDLHTPHAGCPRTLQSSYIISQLFGVCPGQLQQLSHCLSMQVLPFNNSYIANVYMCGVASKGLPPIADLPSLCLHIMSCMAVAQEGGLQGLELSRLLSRAGCTMQNSLTLKKLEPPH